MIRYGGLMRFTILRGIVHPNRARSATMSALLVIVIGCRASPTLRPEELALREARLRELLTQGVHALRLQTREGIARADAAFSIAYELQPMDPRVLDALGCVAFQKGSLTEAARYFRRAISLDRSYDRPVAHLASVAAVRGDRNAARELFELARQLNPVNYRTRNNYARFLAEADELEFAVRELRRASEAAGGKEMLIESNLQDLSSAAGRRSSEAMPRSE